MFRRDFLGSLVSLLGLSNTELFKKKDKIHHKEWGELKEVNLSTDIHYNCYFDKHFKELPVEYRLELVFEKMVGTWTTFNLPMQVYKSLFKLVKGEVNKSPQVKFPELDETFLTGWDLVFEGHRFKMSSLMLNEKV